MLNDHTRPFCSFSGDGSHHPVDAYQGGGKECGYCAAPLMRRYGQEPRLAEVVPLQEAIERCGLEDVVMSDSAAKTLVCFFGAQHAAVNNPGWLFCSGVVEHSFAQAREGRLGWDVSARGVYLSRREDGRLEAVFPA